MSHGRDLWRIDTILIIWAGKSPEGTGHMYLIYIYMDLFTSQTLKFEFWDLPLPGVPRKISVIGTFTMVCWRESLQLWWHLIHLITHTRVSPMTSALLSWIGISMWKSAYGHYKHLCALTWKKPILKEYEITRWLCESWPVELSLTWIHTVEDELCLRLLQNNCIGKGGDIPQNEIISLSCHNFKSILP